jgi:signal transduction histidine kinase
MEDSMAEVKGRLEAFLKALPDMLFEVDKKKNIVWFNAAAGDSPYVSASSIKAEDVLSAEGVAGLDRAIEDADRDGKGTFRYSLPSMQGQRHYEAYVTPVPGNPSSHIFSVRDITEAVMMTEALQRANQRISLLSHFTRHDLINSMTVAEGNLRLCMEEADPMILKGRLEKVGRALREMRGLIVFYREYEEGGRGEPSWHDLSRLVRHEGQVLEQAGISLSVQEGVEAFVDPMFRKVIHNLLDNVAKHSVSARSCRVTFNDTNEGLRMAIEDDGQGIPDVYRSHLFQRGHGSGTGLGLYLSREILSMDGMEVIETSGPGQGARFVISIPPGRYRIRGGANVSL